MSKGDIMKNFLKSFLYCIFGLFVGIIVSNYSHTNAKNIYNISKTNYPILINGEEKKIESLNINGYTYIKLSHLNNNTSLIVNWNLDNNNVDISDSSRFEIREFDNTKYIDITYYFFRYNVSKKTPYYFEMSVSNLNMFGSDGFSVGFLDRFWYENRLYVSLDEFKKKLNPMFIDIILKNEKYLNK